MRTDQWLIVTVIALMMAAFIWGRYRYDIVAAVALIVSMVLGLVPPNKAFSGFSDDIVIIVGSALLLSGAIARSGGVQSGTQAERYLTKVVEATARI